MKLMTVFATLGLLAVGAVTGAHAAVIAGPALTNPDLSYFVSGIGFHAAGNSSLTSFVFQNQGKADTIDLTDAAGNILQSIATSSGNNSQTVNVSWSLVGGNDYFLLQTTLDNSMFAPFNAPLPSNSDIAITFGGTFASSIPNAVNNSLGWTANQYWAAFNDITTTGGTTTEPVPEPLTLSLFATGLAGAAALRRRRKTDKAA